MPTCKRDGCSAPLAEKRAGAVWCSRKCYIAARRALYALHGDVSEPVSALYRNVALVRRPRNAGKRGAL